MAHLIEQLNRDYGSCRCPGLPDRRFPAERLHAAIDSVLNGPGPRFEARTLGTSFEGRPIRLVTAGSGPTKVLLWSQMHGDESTATMAIVDILGYLKSRHDEPAVRELLASLSISFLPMLNPDGAARHQRRTAQGIDMNRDALSLRTPEARLLKELQQSLRPEFGFNLHDQELSTAGDSKELTAIALLAPALDPERSVPPVRRRAASVASAFASAMNHLVPGRVACYDDSFEPRAFGDNMQKWGTSTVLVESGHSIGDPQKDLIRKLNFIGILACCSAIASGLDGTEDASTYENLPFNGKRAYDVIIRNILIDHGNRRTTPADLGISSQVDTHSEEPPRLVDMGDLSTFVGLTEIDGRGRSVPERQLILGEACEWQGLLR